jgi:uncharacterized membrane protein YsdA (DUF1294 family)
MIGLSGTPGGLDGGPAVATLQAPFRLVADHLGNLFVSGLFFATYSTDKAAARAGRRRVPESTLLALGLLGGWPGAIIAQQVLRHKTIKAHFQFAFWGTVALNVAAFVTFTSPISDGFISGLAELTGIS